MTTVFAIECRGGAILASDTQFTGRFRERGSKAWELRDNVVMGIAGANNYNYLFYRRMREAFDSHQEKGPDMTLPDVIDEGIHSFNLEMARRSRTYEIRDEWRPEAVIVGYDEGLANKRRQGRFVMFEVMTPHPCYEIQSLNMRAAVGTGGIAATVFLKTLEDIMDSVGLTYADLSWRTASQLSAILLNRVSQIDPATSGVTILRLVAHSNKVLKETEIFPKYGSRFGINQLLESIFKEVPSSKIAHLVKEWRLDEVLGKALGGGSPLPLRGEDELLTLAARLQLLAFLPSEAFHLIGGYDHAPPEVFLPLDLSRLLLLQPHYSKACS